MSTTAIELPLFPLDVVLFPGTVLPLHIFEPCYRRMVADCQSENKPFGIVFTGSESEPLSEEPYSIGTMAGIHDLDELDDGRFHLIAIGMRRFRILSQSYDKPYLSGLVELFEDAKESEEELFPAMQSARHLFGNYLKMLLEEDDTSKIDAHLPEAPEALSHFIAYFLDVQNAQKQRYLELTSTRQRLQEEVGILRREVPFLRMIMTARPPDDKIMLN